MFTGRMGNLPRTCSCWHRDLRRSVLPHIAEVHDVAAKLAEIGLAAFAQLLRTAEEPPALVGRPSPSELRRDDEAFGVRVEGFGDEPVGDVGS